MMTLPLLALTAHALEPTCIVPWDALQADGRTAPDGGRVQASGSLAVVDDGETVRPLIGLPTACDLGADGPRGQVVGDRVVAFDPAVPAVTWHGLSKGAWSEVDRFDGPFPHQALPQFGTAFVAGADRLAIVSRDGAVRHVDVLRRDGAGWADDGAFQIDEGVERGSWILGDHLRIAAGPFAVRWWDGTAWTSVAPPAPAEGWRRDRSAFDGATLLSNLVDPTYMTARVAVHLWDGAGWTQEAVFEQYPDVGVFEGYQGDVVVSGNLAAAVWVRYGFADTGAPTVDDHTEIHLWRRGMSGWSRVDAFPSPRSGDDLGFLALQGHTLLAGAAQPGVERAEALGAAHGAVYVFDVPVVDADGDGEDERTDPDDLDPTVTSDRPGGETGHTGDTGTSTPGTGDTGATGPLDPDTAVDTDTGGDKGADGGRCGCGHGGGGGLVGSLAAAVALARRRKRAP